MRPDERDRAFLMDMLDSATAVADLVRGLTYVQYAADRRTRRAVERELEIIGEASRCVSPSLRDVHPEVPWQRITATRHRLAHEYGDVDDTIVWRIATVHVTELVTQLELLLKQ